MIKSKDDIRKEISRKRRYLTKFGKKRLDEKIINKLISCAEWEKANTVLIYVSHPREINTVNLIKANLLKKNIVTPKTHLKYNTLSLHIIESFDDLVKGTYNLLEPHPHTKILSPSEIDLAIIPGIAFDKKGHRIGYGKGYYDRLNKHLGCKKISLAYSFQIVDNIPAQIHDTPIDMIITEEKTININH